jgi:hypothetical protein
MLEIQIASLHSKNRYTVTGVCPIFIQHHHHQFKAMPRREKVPPPAWQKSANTFFTSCGGGGAAVRRTSSTTAGVTTATVAAGGTATTRHVATAPSPEVATEILPASPPSTHKRPNSDEHSAEREVSKELKLVISCIFFGTVLRCSQVLLLLRFESANLMLPLLAVVAVCKCCCCVLHVLLLRLARATAAAATAAAVRKCCCCVLQVPPLLFQHARRLLRQFL